MNLLAYLLLFFLFDLFYSFIELLGADASLRLEATPVLLSIDILIDIAASIGLVFRGSAVMPVLFTCQTSYYFYIILELC